MGRLVVAGFSGLWSLAVGACIFVQGEVMECQCIFAPSLPKHRFVVCRVGQPSSCPGVRGLDGWCTAAVAVVYEILRAFLRQPGERLCVDSLVHPAGRDTNRDDSTQVLRRCFGVESGAGLFPAAHPHEQHCAPPCDRCLGRAGIGAQIHLLLPPAVSGAHTLQWGHALSPSIVPADCFDLTKLCVAVMMVVVCGIPVESTASVTPLDTSLCYCDAAQSD